jgi:uncharacterized protein
MPRTAKVVAFSTTPEMAELIDGLAAEEGRTRSDLLREAVRSYAAGRATESAGSALAAEASVTYAQADSAAVRSLPGLALVLAARPRILPICAVAGVARLWVFGSAVRDDFDPEHSDLDFVVRFRPDAPRKPWFGELVDLGDALAAVLGRHVDIGEDSALENPHVRASVDAEKVLVYEQA